MEKQELKDPQCDTNSELENNWEFRAGGREEERDFSGS